jgi:hypothetical protein
MTTYYHDRQVYITSAGIQVDGRWYPLAELEAIRHRRHQRPLSYSAKLLTTIGVFVALVVALVVAAVWAFSSVLGRSDGPGRLMALLVALPVLALVGMFVARATIDGPLEMLDRLHVHGAARHELRASWHGEEIVVFESTDAHRFGKVYRSLRRAIENR